MDKIDAICGESELHYIDAIHECFSCGANEEIGENCMIWTNVLLLIGMIQKKEAI